MTQNKISHFIDVVDVSYFISMKVEHKPTITDKSIFPTNKFDDVDKKYKNSLEEYRKNLKYTNK